NNCFDVYHNNHISRKGVCGDFSEEFQYLAKFVGLECEVYTPSYLHQACLLKINGQWFATDPTGTDPFLSNGKTYKQKRIGMHWNRMLNERSISQRIRIV
ncbi:hypothetical protein, partial [[Clostridium] symbiosum]|uniref:hypothetical protein n=1 Tax=Clostridium symbiosum TaxID=1512 RepID=UPI0034A16F44